MRVLTVPRTVAALEYKALRYPSQLLETKVIATRLPEASRFRLAFERLLGTVDSTAGKLLADQGLTDRGRFLTRRAEILEKAVSLEAKAAERREQASADLRAKTKQAEQQKARAAQEHQRTAHQIAADKAAAKTAVEREAQSQKVAEDKAIAAKTAAQLAAQRDKLRKQEARITAATAARTAAPKAQLSKAVADTQTAQERKAHADRLAELAAAERQSRKSS